MAMDKRTFKLALTYIIILYYIFFVYSYSITDYEYIRENMFNLGGIFISIYMLIDQIKLFHKLACFAMLISCCLNINSVILFCQIEQFISLIIFLLLLIITYCYFKNKCKHSFYGK
jgi:hypothetical protein